MLKYDVISSQKFPEEPFNENGLNRLFDITRLSAKYVRFHSIISHSLKDPGEQIFGKVMIYSFRNCIKIVIVGPGMTGKSSNESALK